MIVADRLLSALFIDAPNKYTLTQYLKDQRTVCHTQIGGALIPTGKEDLQIAGKRAQVRSFILARGDRKNTMTTDNIDGIESTDEILGQLGHLAKEAKQRASAVVRERQGIETRRRNAMRGWRVVERRLRDREEILDEEAIQLDWVLNGDDEGLVLTPDPIVADPEPPASPVVVAPDPPAEPVIVLPDPPEDTPHTPRHLADPPTENVTVVNDHEHVINVRHWTVWQWLGALIGAIIGLVLASVTDQMLFEDNGFGQVLWIIALTGLGFFGGGAIGSTIDG